MTALNTDNEPTVRRSDSASRNAAPAPKNNWLVIGAILLVAVAVVVGAFIMKPAESSTTATAGGSDAGAFALKGEVSLGNTMKGDPKSIGKPCASTPAGGFGDIRKGAQVVVSDATGATVGLATLAGGIERGGPKVGYTCVFTFEVKDVPAGRDHYGVSVAGRTRLQYTEKAVTSDKVTLIYNP